MSRAGATIACDTLAERLLTLTLTVICWVTFAVVVCYFP